MFKRIPLNLFKEFKQRYGHLRIPCKFVVPSTSTILAEGTSPWPAEYHNERLGSLVHSIRRHISGAVNVNYLSSDVERLLEMGFKKNAHHENDDTVLFAFQQYKQIFGHTNIVRSFGIPNDDERWRDDVRGIKLGNTLRHIRVQKRHIRIHKDLVTLGVDLSPQTSERKFEKLFDGFQSYKTIHNHLQIPLEFVIPVNDARYPEQTWGMLLGKKLYGICSHGKYSKYKDRLVALGVEIKVKKVQNAGFDAIYSALVAYKSLHSHVKVPQQFIVPLEDSNYPENTWGLRLGQAVSGIRNRGNYVERREQLLSLGFNYTKRKYVQQKQQQK